MTEKRLSTITNKKQLFIQYMEIHKYNKIILQVKEGRLSHSQNDSNKNSIEEDP